MTHGRGPEPVGWFAGLVWAAQLAGVYNLIEQAFCSPSPFEVASAYVQERV